MVKEGDVAPDFTLKDSEGNEVTLSSFKGEKNVILYFYPKDETPGCTTQACSLRDNWSVIQGQDAIVLGVSSDSEASHKSFKEKHDLPFPLLVDTNGGIRQLYKISNFLFFVPGLLVSQLTI